MPNVRKYLGAKSRAEWLSLGAISFILLVSTILQYTVAPQQSGWRLYCDCQTKSDPHDRRKVTQGMGLVGKVIIEK